MLEGRREAEAAFGNGEGYLEKMILRARHVEVQILGDKQGDIYHLWERDCTVQRRNQKVVERAPAPYLTQEQREEVCELAVRLARAVGYECAGTVEFLMDMDTGKFYFIEVNPRVQVEHTVTEEVTGIDIVRAQILIEEGKTPRRGDRRRAAGGRSSSTATRSSAASRPRTRSTTSSPTTAASRCTASATGPGIRLDGGTAYSGAVITRYYDSLLTKVTARAPTPEMAIARMDRALREFRIRGVSTNIDFVVNLLKHPTFLTTAYTTKFIDTTPELFQFAASARTGRRRILTYIADITVNGHPETAGRPEAARRGARRPAAGPVPLGAWPAGTRQLLDEKGPKAVADWMKAQKRLLVTDTTMRDGHQSLLATRMRSIDMIRAAPAYAQMMPGLFSRRMLGRRDLRRGLPLPAGMPLAAPARHPRADAEHHDADAAARLERRGLHQLPRQRGASLRRAGGEVGRGRVPRLRLAQLGREHARRHGRGDRGRTRSARRRSATPATSSTPTAPSTTSSTTSPWRRSCEAPAPTSSASRTWRGSSRRPPPGSSSRR